MKRMILGALCMLLLCSGSWALIPHQISYQGHLYDPNGTAMTGVYDIEFRLYDAESGGTALWSETHSAVAAIDGLFQVILGVQTELDLPFDNGYFLELVIEGETMSPRQSLTSVGHAYQAEDVLGQDIHPRSVSIESVGEVIDATGQWVGDPTGLIGPQGIQGEVGPMGPTGPQGVQGEPGSMGPMGPTGPQGVQGEPGSMGPTGPQGIQGEVGPMGPTGPQGVQGEPGSMGPTGPQGIQGEVGPMGATGAQGVQGEPGPMGATGAQGVQGEPGPMGPTGAQGVQGEAGPMGSTGPQGVQGEPGPMGSTGPQGVQGEPGPIGPAGPQGIQGVRGPTGLQGIQGPAGPVGGANKQVVYNDNGAAAGSEIYYDKTTTNVGIGTASPGQKLSVNGVIESTSGGVKFPDGSVQTVAGKIVNVTMHSNATRRVLPDGASITMESFTVDKKRSDSSLLIQGTISGWGNYSGDMTQGWRFGSGTEVLAQGVMYDDTTYSRIYSTQAVITGHTTTGPQTMVFRYFANNGSTGERPFIVYNPNASDQARLGQTRSSYVVWEIAP